eukprot:5096381-Pyramimonas_sp.AAC.1
MCVNLFGEIGGGAVHVVRAMWSKLCGSRYVVQAMWRKVSCASSVVQAVCGTLRGVRLRGVHAL